MARTRQNNVEEAEVQVEDVFQKFVRILNTDVTQVGRHGNTLHLTVKADMARRLNIQQGERFYVWTGFNSYELKDVIEHLGRVDYFVWILMVKKV